jgi:CcmD family protein
MIYLGLAFTVLWLVSFGYMFILDRQMKDLKRRLDARDSSNLSA